MIFRCKMCGDSLDIIEGTSIAECESCGTKQTVPKVTDENLQNLFNRANTLRIKSEFDKAEKLYEKIVQVDSTQSEAYWGLILCKYGIEYVEDPATFKKVPTCHRASYDSIIADDDYKSALEYADIIQRGIYEEQAKEIDKIQKDILALAQKEETYDVFICYKETDANGSRTQDSVIANDIYYQLTQEGFKVFYAAITLEGKLGSAYEPIIFAALNSAKVMLSIGTKPEYFNAVWVKNEWSRFLKIIKKDRSKLLIPCYRDMDAYELPEEFAHLQAQDMAKIGFINDLIRGIKKVVPKDEPKQAAPAKETVVVSANPNTAPLLRRAFMFLEDADWVSANEYCEKVLDLDPENAQAYLGKLMADLRVKTQDSLKDQAAPFDGNNNYGKVLRFADDDLRSTLVGYVDHINTRNENQRLTDIYTRATQEMSTASSEAAFKSAACLFESISQYRDSAELAKECFEKAEITRKDTLLTDGKNRMARNTVLGFEDAIKALQLIPGWKDADELLLTCQTRIIEIKEQEEIARKNSILSTGKNRMAQDTIEGHESAIKYFEKIPGWKDADNLRTACQKRIDEINAADEARRLEHERLAEIAREKAMRTARKIKIISAVTTLLVCTAIIFIIILNTVIIPNIKYDDALALMGAGKYSEAIDAFNELDGYKDSFAKVDECYDAIYNGALALMDAGKYNEAIEIFDTLDSYEATDAKKAECKTAIQYSNALLLMESGNIVDAYEALVALNGYKDSADKAESIRIQYNREKLKTAKVGDYISFGLYEQDNNTSNGKEDIRWLVLAVTNGKALVISEYALDCMPYNTSWDASTCVTWDTCTLRNWLNNDFIDKAFSTDEQSMIPTLTVPADGYETVTQDKLFLLSITEVNEYLTSNNARKCTPTAYAVANGTFQSSLYKTCTWWLRSHSQGLNCATTIDTFGDIDDTGTYVDSKDCAVRPAMWIDLNA